MKNLVKDKYLICSIVLHLALLIVFIFNFAFTSTIPVLENTSEQDVISAVILGDTAKSNIVAPPQNIPPPAAMKKALAQNAQLQPPAEKEVIAIKKAPEKIEKPKPAVEANKKLKELLGKNLLADIENTKIKQQKIKQKQLQNKYEKMLKQQAEQTLRQQILNENIKLQNDRERKARGIVNKYKALILQTISAQWVVPSQVNRKLTLSVMIRLAPGGTVLDVQVIKTSGSPSLDSSVRAAILKANRLPVPQKPDEFEIFRQFILKVKPENIINNQSLTMRG